MTSFRTDNNNNPVAFTTDVAKEAGLLYNVDFVYGERFQEGSNTYFTAKLLGDPRPITIKVIDKLGFYTRMPNMRWSYMAMPYELWMSFDEYKKLYVIGQMYICEGGVAMSNLFPKNL